jgi:hypothetical protein
MKIRVLCLYLFATIFGGAAFAADSGEKLKVLVVTGGHGFQRDPFFQMFADNPAITFTEAKQIKTSEAYDREDLRGSDVVVLYDMVQNITDAQKAKFLSLFDKGIGLVVLHHALVSYKQWPDFERIIGGRYPDADSKSGVVTPEVGYEHDVDIPVVIVAQDHPVVAGLSNFVIHDEIYWGFRVGPDITRLLTTTHPKSGKPLLGKKKEGSCKGGVLEAGAPVAVSSNSSAFRAWKGRMTPVFFGGPCAPPKRSAGFIPQEREHRRDGSAKSQSPFRWPTPLRTEVRAPGAVSFGRCARSRLGWEVGLD